MRLYQKIVITLLSFGLILSTLSGCGATEANAAEGTSSEESGTAAIPETTGTHPTEAEETEGDEETFAGVTVNAFCLQLKQDKANLLQNVMITASEYLNSAITPIQSFEIDTLEDNNYVMVVEVSLPALTPTMLQYKDIDKLWLRCTTEVSTDNDLNITKVSSQIKFAESYTYSGTMYSGITKTSLFCLDNSASSIKTGLICCLQADNNSNLNFNDVSEDINYHTTVHSPEILGDCKYLFIYQLMNEYTGTATEEETQPSPNATE